MQEQKDVLLTADIGGTNCRFSLWQANIKADVVYDEIFTKVSHSDCVCASVFKRFTLKPYFDGCMGDMSLQCLCKALDGSKCKCNTCSKNKVRGYLRCIDAQHDITQFCRHNAVLAFGLQLYHCPNPAHMLEQPDRSISSWHHTGQQSSCVAKATTHQPHTKCRLGCADIPNK